MKLVDEMKTRSDTFLVGANPEPKNTRASQPGA